MDSANDDANGAPANQVYDIVEHRMNRLKRLALMGSFWALTLISMGSATPVPSTNAFAIVRISDGKVVSIVDDEMAGENSVRVLLDADLQSMTQAEFEHAWGIVQAI